MNIRTEPGRVVSWDCKKEQETSLCIQARPITVVITLQSRGLRRWDEIDLNSFVFAHFPFPSTEGYRGNFPITGPTMLRRGMTGDVSNSDVETYTKYFSEGLYTKCL